MPQPPPGFANTVFADEYLSATPVTEMNPPPVIPRFGIVDPETATNYLARPFQTVERYQHVIVRGRRAVNIASRVTKMHLSLSTAEQSELSISVDDPDFRLLRTGIFVDAPPVTYQGLQLQIAGVETGAGGRGTLTLRARSRFVQRLKWRRGPLVVQGGPREFIGYECQQVGMPFVTSVDDWLPGTMPPEYYARTSRDWQPYVQPTALDAPDAIPSSWTTFKRLAQQRGWLLFEAANVMYFAPPTWLFRNSRIVRVRYVGTPEATRTRAPKLNRTSYGVVVGPDGLQRPTVLHAGGMTAPGVIELLEPPTCTYSQDQLGTTVQFKVEAGNEGWFLPGCVVDLQGVPYFAGLYLCNGVDFDLDGTDVTITASTPVDQQPEQGATALTHGYSAAGSGTALPGSSLIASDSAQLGLPVCGITLPHFLAALKLQESGDYGARPTSVGGPSGAYQYAKGTWIQWAAVALGADQLAKYPEAYLAPASLQDAVAKAEVTATYQRYDGDWGKCACYHIYPKLADQPSYWHFYPGEEPGGPGRIPNNPRLIDYVRSVLQKANGVICTQTDPGPGRKTRHAADFVATAVAQSGDAYVWAAVDPVSDANPATFDCSSLVQWAAGRVGVTLPRYSGDQWQACKKADRVVTPENALLIRGALLFVDKGGIEGGEHVAISMGDGRREMAAHSPRLGVGIASTTAAEWDRAGLIPGMIYPGIDTVPHGY